MLLSEFDEYSKNARLNDAFSNTTDKGFLKKLAPLLNYGRSALLNCGDHFAIVPAVDIAVFCKLAKAERSARLTLFVHEGELESWWGSYFRYRSYLIDVQSSGSTQRTPRDFMDYQNWTKNHPHDPFSHPMANNEPFSGLLLGPGGKMKESL